MVLSLLPRSCPLRTRPATRRYLVAVALALTLLCAACTVVGYYYLTIVSLDATAAASTLAWSLSIAFVVAAAYFLFGLARSTRHLYAALGNPQGPVKAAWTEAVCLGDRMVHHVAATGVIATITTVVLAREVLCPELLLHGVLASMIVMAVEVALVLPLSRQLMLPVLNTLRTRNAALSTREAAASQRTTLQVIVCAVALLTTVGFAFTATIVLRMMASELGELASLLHLGAVHLVLWTGLALLIAWNTRLALVPLGVLAAGADRIHDLESDWRAGVVGVAEIGTLAEAFDGMLDRLRESRGQLLEKERLLTHRQRLESIGTLASGIAHEINNPTAYIRTNLEYLLETLSRRDDTTEAATREECVQALTDSLDGVDRIRRIASELTRHARAELEEAPSEFRLTALIESTLGIVRTQIDPGTTVDVRFREPTTVVARIEAVRQVLINLMVNAAQALAGMPGGRICVTCGAELGQPFIEVQDNGPGIPQENQARVFEPFFTTKPTGSGTGLGLYICRTIVEREHGQLTLQSRPGDTRFRLWLPARAAPAKVATPRAPEVILAQLPIRLLVIDDDPAVRRSMQRALRDRIRVVTACEAGEAIALLREGEVFDAVLCDWLMPQMSGGMLLSHLRRHHPPLARRFAFLTAGAKDAGLALESAGVPVFLKPCSTDELVRWCAEVTRPT